MVAQATLALLLITAGASESIIFKSIIKTELINPEIKLLIRGNEKGKINSAKIVLTGENKNTVRGERVFASIKVKSEEVRISLPELLFFIESSSFTFPHLYGEYSSFKLFCKKGKGKNVGKVWMVNADCKVQGKNQLRVRWGKIIFNSEEEKIILQENVRVRYVPE